MMAMNSLSSVMDTISNPDMSGWEKFTSITLSLSMAVPMLINGWKSLNSVINMETITIGLNTIAKKLNEHATRAQTNAKSKDHIMTKKLNKETAKNT
jgi:hypothetical protein